MYHLKGYGFLGLFGLKINFGLELGMVFEASTAVYEYIYQFQFQMSKKEREICEFEMGLKNFAF